MAQLFQDIEGRSYPVLVIDCHDGQPITKLYLAYSPSRRSKEKNHTQQNGKDQSSHLA